MTCDRSPGLALYWSGTAAHSCWIAEGASPTQDCTTYGDTQRKR